MKLPRVSNWIIVSIYVPILGVFAALFPQVSGIMSILWVIGFGVLLLFRHLHPDKTVLFRLVSDTPVLSIEDEEAVKDEVRIVFNGEEVKGNISLVFLKLWNVSSKPILPEDYKKDIRINFGKEAKILSVQVSESKPPNIKVDIDDQKQIRFDNENVFLAPIWLNTDNSLTLKILVANFQGDISTDESRIIVGGFVRDWNDTSYRKINDLIGSRFGEGCGCIITYLVIFILAGLILIPFPNLYNNLDKVPILALLLVFVCLFGPVIITGYIVDKIRKYLMRTFD